MNIQRKPFYFVPMGVPLKVIKAIVSPKVYILFILILCIVPLNAVNDQETFLQANKQYQESNYEKALSLYSKIMQKGAATWYNMGNCHYRLGHEADALICWSRSQMGAPQDIKRDSAYNIDLVLNGFDESNGNRGFIQRVYSVFHYGSTLLVQILFLLLWACMCVVIRLSKRGKKYKVATFILAIMLVPFAITVGLRYWRSEQKIAFVHTDAKMYAGPNEKFHIVASVAAKDKLTVYTKNDNWYKVAHQKNIGWVSSDAIVVL